MKSKRLYFGGIAIELMDNVSPSAVVKLMDCLIMCCKSTTVISYTDGKLLFLQGQEAIRKYANNHKYDKVPFLKIFKKHEK